MKKIVKLFIVFFCCFLIVGCNDNNTKVGVTMINKDQVIDYMNDGAILIDVRTKEEFASGNIEGSINIDVNDILSSNGLIYNGVKKIDTNSVVIVYCRSGNRSNQAANKLLELGYTNVYDFGSIDNWSN